jgi:hypothetical protein
MSLYDDRCVYTVPLDSFEAELAHPDPSQYGPELCLRSEECFLFLSGKKREKINAGKLQLISVIHIYL